MPLHHVMLVLAICLAWGGNFLALAFAVAHFPPLLCTALRLIIVLACLLPLIRPLPAGQRLRAAAVAVCGGALHFGLIVTGLRLAGDISSVALVLQSFVPMSAVMAALWLGERLDRRTAAGITASFAGVLVLGFDPLALDAPAALAFTLAAAAAL